MDELQNRPLNRKAFSVVRLEDADDAVAYWRTKTPEERLCALEAIRQVVYGYTPDTGRLKRVLTVVKRPCR